MIVADTNLIAYLLLPGEHTPAARAVLEVDEEWAAPPLWRSEFLNVLAHHLRRETLRQEDAAPLVRDAEALIGEREYRVDAEDIFDLVAGSSCSAYDCEFVAAARWLGVPLVTSDRQVLRSFPGVARAPDMFAAGN